MVSKGKQPRQGVVIAVIAAEGSTGLGLLHAVLGSSGVLALRGLWPELGLWSLPMSRAAPGEGEREGSWSWCLHTVGQRLTTSQVPSYPLQV